MTAMTTAAVVGIAAGVNAITGGGVTKALGFSKDPAEQAKETARAADPFYDYRGNLASMYSGYLQPGATMDPKTMPGYSQFQTGVLDPAMEASKRSAAASGMSMSGKEQVELQNVGQRGYYGFMTDYMNRLAQGSGAANNPAQAYGMGLNQAAMNNMGVMQGMGALSTGLASYGKLNQATQPAYTGSVSDPLTGNENTYGTGMSGYEATQADIYGPSVVDFTYGYGQN